MFFRIAMPLLMMLGPRLLPHLLKYILLVWRLTFDKRVPLILRALVPLSILYVLSPFDLIKDQMPIIGRADDILMVSLALLLLLKLSPRRVVDEHLGRRAPDQPPQEKDPSKVVEGSSKPLDDG